MWTKNPGHQEDEYSEKTKPHVLLVLQAGSFHHANYLEYLHRRIAQRAANGSIGVFSSG